MAKHIVNIAANTGEFDAKIKAAIRMMKTYEESCREVGGTLEFAGQEAQDFAKSLGTMTSRATTTNQRLNVMNTLLKETEVAYSHLTAAEKRSPYGKAMSTSIDQLRSKVQALNSDMATMSGKGGSSLLGAVFGGNIASQAVTKAWQTLKNVVKDAVDANKEFEYSNATLAAVLGQSKEEIIDLTIQAEKLGAASLYSANEITQLQIALARLGFNKQEIEDSTDAIAKLALATGVTLNEAATLTGSTLRAFGYSTKEAARVASVLGVSTTKSALDMDKLKIAMGYASSVSRQAGFDIEEVVAMLGKLVDSGQQATTAGVNIRNIMLDLSNKSSKLSKAIKEVTGKDQVRGFDEFIDALNKLVAAGINLDDVSNVVEKRVTPGFLNLLANTKGIKDLSAELQGCTGELDAMAAKMEDTLQGATKKLSNSWNALMLTFKESNGVLKDTVSVLDEIIDRMARQRNLSLGGDAALSVLTSGSSEIDKLAESMVSVFRNMGSGNNSDADILQMAQSSRDTKGKSYEYARGLYDRYDALNKRYKGGVDAALFNEAGKLDAEIKKSLGLTNFIELRDYVAKLSDEMAALDLIIAKMTDQPASADISHNAGIGFGEKEVAKSVVEAKMTPLEKEWEKVQNALNDSMLAVKVASMEYESGLIDDVEYNKKMLTATKRMVDAYGNAAAQFDDPEFQRGFDNAVESYSNLATATAGLVQAQEEHAQAERDAAAQLKEARKVDKHTYEQLFQIVKDARSKNPDNTTTAELMSSLGKFRDRMNVDVGLDIPDEEWKTFVDELNKRLRELGLNEIEVDFKSGNVVKRKGGETGNILFGEINPYSGSVVGFAGTMVNGISTIADNLETLGVTVSEDFKEGLSKVQAVISIISTIGSILGTISSVVMAVGVLKSIPIFGAVLHAGGIVHAAGGYSVPGALNGGKDTVPAILSPGELVLNRAQQVSLAAQLTSGSAIASGRLSTRIKGGDIIVALDNTNRARGGSRGLYAYSK